MSIPAMRLKQAKPKSKGSSLIPKFRILPGFPLNPQLSRFSGAKNFSESATLLPSEGLNVSRDEWIAVFEGAASKPPEGMNDEWAWLLQQLSIPFTQYLAVVETLRQGRWRTAKDPRAYVKTVAKRVAKKMIEPDSNPVFVDLSEPAGGGFSNYEQVLDNLSYEGEGGSPSKRSDGVWRGGGRRGYDYEDPRGVYGSYRGFLMKDIPSELLNSVLPSQEYQDHIEEVNRSTSEFHIHIRPRIAPKWDQWCANAGFDKWETLAVTFKTEGVSRERALASQPDEDSRKALQAAWKRFDRTGGERLRAALKKFRTKDVPEYDF